MDENEISYKVIGIAIELHKNLGPGLLESVYEATFAYDLVEAGFDVKKQLAMPVVYKEIVHEIGFRIDLLINDKVIIELKAVEVLTPTHFAQTLTYLKLANKKLGLLINFNSKQLKDGIHRVVNSL